MGQQGLRPNAVLIEDAANGPAVPQMLRRRVPGMLSRLAWQQLPDSLSRVATDVEGHGSDLGVFLFLADLLTLKWVAAA
jgi:hypothetical protein